LIDGNLNDEKGRDKQKKPNEEPRGVFSGMLKLYHYWSSTCSRKVRFCLAEKQLEWESRHTDIIEKKEHLEPWYIELNPNGVVPTLDHDGNIVTESNIIIEYLDSAFPDIPLRPQNPVDQARMRLWLDKAETTVHRHINIISYNKRHIPRMKNYTENERREIIMRYPNKVSQRVMLRRLARGVSADDEAFAESVLSDVMDEMEATLSGSTWLAGDSFSLADISIAPFIERFEANGLERLVDFSNRPSTGDWWTRVQSRESFKTALAFANPDA